MDNFITKNKVPKEYLHLFSRQEISAKTVLLEEGNVATHMFYIEQGCLRLCFDDNGKDITFQFFFEDEYVASIESFKANIPSLFTLESIEPCVLYSISRKNFQTMLDTSLAFREQFEEHIFHRLIFYQKLFLSRIKDSPEKRYIKLLENNPQLLQRVPQHYIASYLGITPVSLSRIRNRR